MKSATGGLVAKRNRTVWFSTSYSDPEPEVAKWNQASHSLFTPMILLWYVEMPSMNNNTEIWVELWELFPRKKLTIIHRYRSGQWGINCFKVFFCSVPSTGNTETGVATSVWFHTTDFHWKWLVAWITATGSVNTALFVSLFLWVSTCCAELLSPSSSSSHTNTADLHTIP